MINEELKDENLMLIDENIIIGEEVKEICEDENVKEEILVTEQPVLDDTKIYVDKENGVADIVEIEPINDEQTNKNLKFGDVLSEKKVKVYVKVNTEGFITDINSDVFLKNFDGWTEYDEGEGDRFVHAQTSYFENSIVDDFGNYNYKY